MTTAAYLLMVLGFLGALDVVVYHSVAHGIRSHHDSIHELIVHSWRGPVYAVQFLLVPNFALAGGWMWALLIVIAIDVTISIWDFAIERESRRQLGGLPSGEYVLHMIMAMVFGAFASAIIAASRESIHLPTAITYQPAIESIWPRLIMVAMAVAVFVSGVQDVRAVRRLRGLEGMPWKPS